MSRIFCTCLASVGSAKAGGSEGIGTRWRSVPPAGIGGPIFARRQSARLGILLRRARGLDTLFGLPCGAGDWSQNQNQNQNRGWRTGKPVWPARRIPTFAEGTYGHPQRKHPSAVAAGDPDCASLPRTEPYPAGDRPATQRHPDPRIAHAQVRRRERHHPDDRARAARYLFGHRGCASAEIRRHRIRRGRRRAPDR